MSSRETSFDQLLNVPVHYDRLDSPNGYGSKGKQQTFFCRNRLKDTLEDCFSELFDIWNRDKPSIILTAGTTGDGNSAHGQGYAFDLDGFYWGDDRFMMDRYPDNRALYVGINAHLFLYFSQVLSYHYSGHHDHFHVDFNFSYRYRTSSNAQTFFVQSCLVYLFGKNIGTTGSESDGIDGVYGGDTKIGLTEVLRELGLRGQGGLTQPSVWNQFLIKCRAQAFEQV